ncbi:MAG TPA: hypothetical protein VM911_05165 [Pyrinomonadaceae bacterium]|nr:hypothetical protein [Pyrinomonadaceae bacterium]
MRPHSSKRLHSARISPAVLTALQIFVLSLLVGSGPVCFGQTEEAVRITATSQLQNYYTTQDEHYANVAARLPDIQSALDRLRAAVTAAQAQRPKEFEAEFDDCLKAIRIAGTRAKNAVEAADVVVRFGSVANLFTTDVTENGGLAKVISCARNLERALGGQRAIAEAIAGLGPLYEELNKEFERIDESRARKRAKAAMRHMLLKKAQAETGQRAVPDTAETSGCRSDINFQEEGYRIRKFRIEDPFKFLPWVRKRQQRAEELIKELFKDPTFRYSAVAGEALDIIDKVNFLPDTSDARVKLRVELVSVENCSGKELDLVYRIYSTQIMPVLSSAPEARVTERESPQTAAGQTTVKAPTASPIHITPAGGYDSTDKLSGGGRLEITPGQFGGLPFDSAFVEGQASSTMKTISAALSGSADSEGWLAHSEWLLDYNNYSLPTGAGQIKGGHMTAQFSGMSKPLVNGNLTFRFGTLLEGGNRQSSIRNVPLAPDTLANAGFGSLKFYAGMASRLRHNVFSLSYGLELGSVGPAARIDWRKHIGDFRHEFWYPLGNHRILDLESRLTVGRIQVPGKIPLSERFFGGNNEQFFIPGDIWEIRENPVIRAIPGSRLYRTADGAGGERFFSYNLTAAYTVWRKALVPQELTDDPSFNSVLGDALDTITGNLQNTYATKDPHYQTIVTNLLPRVNTALTDLQMAVTNSQQAHPGQAETKFKMTLRAITTAIRRANSAANPVDVGQQYGNVRALLSPSEDEGENRLAKVMTSVQGLTTELGGDASITTAATALDGVRASMESEFGQIDQVKAASMATASMAFTRRTLNTLFNDVNIYSVSPVIVFDAARISRERAGLGGMRYGPGLGLRFELASVAHFTAGYAWNVRPGPDEGHGTFFFSIGVRDLFR